jgi:hypothetical protein
MRLEVYCIRSVLSVPEKAGGHKLRYVQAVRGDYCVGNWDVRLLSITHTQVHVYVF